MYKYDTKRICYRIESLRVSHNSRETLLPPKSFQIYHLETVFPAGLGNDRCARDHHFYVQKDNTVVEKKKNREKDRERKDQHKLEIFSNEFMKSLLGKKIPEPGPEKSSRPSESQNPATKTSNYIKNFSPPSLPFPFCLSFFSFSFIS